MTYEEWWWDFIAAHEDWRYADSDALRKASFKGGAASRDAEVAELKAELETERRLSFRNQVAELEAERDKLRDAEIDDLGESLAQVKLKNELLIDERDQLREQVKMLRDAIEYSGVAKGCQELADVLATTEPKA